MPEPASSHNASALFDDRVASLRTTAKWLLTISAGIGAVLATGLPLTGLGQLPLSSWRLYVAVAAAVVALIAIAYMVKVSSTLLTQEWLTLADFADEATGVAPDGAIFEPARHTKAIVDRLSVYSEELYEHVARSPAHLLAQLREANDSIHQAGSSGDRAALAGAVERSQQLRQVAHDVAQVANYYLALHLFRAMRVRLAFAAAAFVASIVVYAYASQPPQQPERPLEVKIVTWKTGHPHPISTAS
jgi:hypothetical protein